MSNVSLMSWDRYSDETMEMSCSKCGKRHNSYSYHPSCDVRYGEHLHYTCTRCGYDWTGNTLDNQNDK